MIVAPPPPLADRRRACRAARKMLVDLDVEHPGRVAPELLAHDRGVGVRTADLRGAQATLVRADGRAIIVVARGLGLRQRRFVILHELGHYDLHAHVSFLGLCTGDALPFASSTPFEDEASAYASEGAMPRKLALPYCADEEGCWDAVRELSDEFNMSLSASALRFVTLSTRAVAVVCLRDGAVKWSRRAWRFKDRIPQGRLIAPPSSAARATPLWPGVRTRVPAALWVDGAPAGATIVEHAFLMPVAGVVMVMLERERGE